MRKVTVITCFSYHNNKKYTFHPNHLRSDLRRIISFSHNSIGCDLNDIYVLTDIVPSSNIRQEILEDFQFEVHKVLSSKNKIGSIYWPGLKTQDLNDICTELTLKTPLKWLKQVCKDACNLIKVQINSVQLYEILLQKIVPVIRNTSIVEFASLFTRFGLISGPQHYHKMLKNIFSEHISHLFFYYTGHGIKIYTHTDSSRHDVHLVIPASEDKDKVGFYSQQQLQHCFNRILSKVHAFIVFDCCHAEKLLDVSDYFDTDIIYLSSTQRDQTCGFYDSYHEFGSVYTYYLMNFLNLVMTELQQRKYKIQLERLYNHVETKVNKYRSTTGKPPQNMFISLSKDIIQHLPSWLFERITIKNSHAHCLTLVEFAH